MHVSESGDYCYVAAPLVAAAAVVQVRVMVHERDEIIFNRLRQLRGCIVAVVGMVSAPPPLPGCIDRREWSSYQVPLAVRDKKLFLLRQSLTTSCASCKPQRLGGTDVG